MFQLTGACGHLLRQIGKIIWRSTGSDHGYLARRDQNYVAIAGQFDETPFCRSFGNLEPLGGRQSYAMTGNLISEARHSMAQWISVYR